MNIPLGTRLIRSATTRTQRFAAQLPAIAAIAGLFLAAGLFAQTTRHVATPAAGGNDANTGTIAAPYATIQRATNLAAPGDTILVGAGTFAGFNIGAGLTAEGLAAAPITIRGTRGGAASELWLTIINIEAPRFNGTTHHARINIDTASYIILEDLEVVGLPDQRVSKAGIRIVMPPDGDDGHITIRRCHVHHNGEWGVFTGHVHHITIEDSLIHDQVDEHGVYLSNSGDDHIVRNNIIHSNSANGLHVNSDESQGGDGVIRNVLVERNTLYNNGGGSAYIDGAGISRTSVGGGSAINFDGVRDSTIQNNVVYDNHASGVSLYRIDGLLPSSNNLVANNTIINAANGRWCLNITDASAGNTVFNNILLNNHPLRGSITISADTLAAGGIVSDHNIVMDRLDPGVDAPRTLAQWQAATGQDAHSTAIAQGSWPAAFISLANFDLHLSPTSAAKDAGIAAFGGRSAPAVDREGHARPTGTAFDIGAYEFAAAPPICAADFNNSGTVSVQDIFDFLNAYFTADPRADHNAGGGISVQDVFDYLADYFVPC